MFRWANKMNNNHTHNCHSQHPKRLEVLVCNGLKSDINLTPPHPRKKNESGRAILIES